MGKAAELRAERQMTILLRDKVLVGMFIADIAARAALLPDDDPQWAAEAAAAARDIGEGVGFTLTSAVWQTLCLTAHRARLSRRAGQDDMPMLRLESDDDDGWV